MRVATTLLALSGAILVSCGVVRSSSSIPQHGPYTNSVADGVLMTTNFARIQLFAPESVNSFPTRSLISSNFPNNKAASGQSLQFDMERKALMGFQVQDGCAGRLAHCRAKSETTCWKLSTTFFSLVWLACCLGSAWGLFSFFMKIQGARTIASWMIVSHLMVSRVHAQFVFPDLYYFPLDENHVTNNAEVFDCVRERILKLQGSAARPAGGSAYFEGTMGDNAIVKGSESDTIFTSMKPFTIFTQVTLSPLMGNGCGTIISKAENQETTEFAVCVSLAGDVMFYYSWYSIGLKVGSFATDTWYSLAFVFDGTTWTAYKNGVPYSWSGMSTIATPHVEQPIRFGIRGTYGLTFPGRVSVVAMFSSALTKTQIVAITSNIETWKSQMAARCKPRPTPRPTPQPTPKPVPQPTPRPVTTTTRTTLTPSSHPQFADMVTKYYDVQRESITFDPVNCYTTQATMTIKYSGIIKAVVLRHVRGKIGTSARASQSHFGDANGNKLMMVIARKTVAGNDEIIFPRPGTVGFSGMESRSNLYTMAPYTANSDTLIFEGPPLAVVDGDKIYVCSGDSVGVFRDRAENTGELTLIADLFYETPANKLSVRLWNQHLQITVLALSAAVGVCVCLGIMCCRFFNKREHLLDDTQPKFYGSVSQA